MNIASPLLSSGSNWLDLQLWMQQHNTATSVFGDCNMAAEVWWLAVCPTWSNSRISGSSWLLHNSSILTLEADSPSELDSRKSHSQWIQKRICLSTMHTGMFAITASAVEEVESCFFCGQGMLSSRQGKGWSPQVTSTQYVPPLWCWWHSANMMLIIWVLIHLVTKSVGWPPLWHWREDAAIRWTLDQQDTGESGRWTANSLQISHSINYPHTTRRHRGSRSNIRFPAELPSSLC